VVLNGQNFINQAFIENASITTAMIGALQISTLNITGNAVTIPVGATASGSPASCSMTLTQAGTVQVIGFINFDNNTSNGQSVLLAVTDGATTSGQVGISVSAGYSGSASTSAIFNLGAGTYTFTLAPSMSGCTLETNSIIAIGMMK
jgi:hypothetical protein